MALLDDIATATGCHLSLVDAEALSTFKGGGKAWIFQPENVQKFIDVTRVLSDEKIVFEIIGRGSNTLISDGVCNTVLINTKALNGVKTEGRLVYCECGANLSKVISECRKSALGGLEFLSGVPCSVGGAIKMNAGAFGSQIGDYIYKLQILNVDCVNGGKITMTETSKDELRLSYRNGVDSIVVGAVLLLNEKDEERSLKEAKRYLSFRHKKQPCLPSLGSVFKNGREASGKLIEECGLKGIGRGGARISGTHANFIVNEGGASAADYLYLVELCKKRVYEAKGVRLEEEFVLIK